MKKIESLSLYCPNCNSSKVSIEKQLDGRIKCEQCGYSEKNSAGYGGFVRPPSTTYKPFYISTYTETIGDDKKQSYVLRRLKPDTEGHLRCCLTTPLHGGFLRRGVSGECNDLPGSDDMHTVISPRGRILFEGRLYRYVFTDKYLRMYFRHVSFKRAYKR